MSVTSSSCNKLSTSINGMHNNSPDRSRSTLNGVEVAQLSSGHLWYLMLSAAVQPQYYAVKQIYLTSASKNSAHILETTGLPMNQAVVTNTA